MKQFITMFFILFFSTLAYSNSIEFSYEAGEIKIEYYETSKEGRVFVNKCDYCDQSIYKFTTPPVITIRDKVMPLKEFLKQPKRKGGGTIIIQIINGETTITSINF